MHLFTICRNRNNHIVFRFFVAHVFYERKPIMNMNISVFIFGYISIFGYIVFCCDISINLADFFSCFFSSGKFHWFFTWIQANQMNWKKKTNENYFCNLLKIHDGKKRSVVAKLLQKYFHRNVQIALLIFTRIQRFTKFWWLNIQVSEKIVDFHVHLFALDWSWCLIYFCYLQFFIVLFLFLHSKLIFIHETGN